MTGRTGSILGILNVTPDSFSDAGRWMDAGAACDRAFRMVEEGADAIDIGGASSRPGAPPVGAAEERRRVEPVLRRLAGRLRVPVSIDTSHPDVARLALDEGATIVNDIRALGDPGLRRLVAERKAGAIVMHMRGEPGTMQDAPQYGDVVEEVRAFLEEAVRRCEEDGIPRERLWVDPGIGFGKTHEHNLSLLAALPRVRVERCRLCVGPSRKAFLGRLLDGAPVLERLEGTLACVALAAAAGAEMIRVHDVREAKRAARVAAAIARAGAKEGCPS